MSSPDRLPQTIRFVHYGGAESHSLLVALIDGLYGANGFCRLN